MGAKASSYHQCLELNTLTQQHYPPSPINLQVCSFLQASSVENPTQCRLLSHSVTHHPHFNLGRRAMHLCLFFLLVGFLLSLII